jgi:hypothetical protein
MPAGTPHAASAQEVVSGHLTVGVHVTPWRDVLTGVWVDIVKHLDDPIPAGWTGDPEGFARELEERLRTLAAELEQVDTREEAQARVERFLSNRAQLARGTIAERSSPLNVDDDTVLRRRTETVCELRIHGDLLVVLLGDRRLEMPAWLEPAMRRIADLAPFTLGELAAIIPDPESRAVLGRRLIREGLLTARDSG